MIPYGRISRRDNFPVIFRGHPCDDTLREGLAGKITSPLFSVDIRVKIPYGRISMRDNFPVIFRGHPCEDTTISV